MGPLRVVVLAEVFDDDARFGERATRAHAERRHEVDDVGDLRQLGQLGADLGVVDRKGEKWGTGGNLNNLTVGVLKGSTAATYVQNLPGNVVEVLYPTQTGAYSALLRGAVKTVVNDYAQSDWYVKNNAADFALSALIQQPGQIAFAFTKNQVALRNAFNKGLAVLRHNGTLLRLKNAWIG